jgi:hypothetical protein
MLLAGVCVAACSTAMLPTASASDDVVISSFGHVVTVSVGQTLRIVRPGDTPDWQVDYAADKLQALQSSEQLRSPGPDGWRFKAIAAGESDIMLTPIVKADPGHPAPPAPPPHFIATIRAR